MVQNSRWKRFVTKRLRILISEYVCRSVKRTLKLNIHEFVKQKMAIKALKARNSGEKKSSLTWINFMLSCPEWTDSHPANCQIHLLSKETSVL